MSDQPAGGGQPPGGNGGEGGQGPPSGWGTPQHQPGPPPPQGQQPPGQGQQPPGQGQPPQQPPAQAYPPGYFAQLAESGYQPAEDEMQEAFHAHLFGAIVALLCCGWVLPVAAPFLVFAMAKEKRPFMIFHVNQSIIFQLIAVVAIIGIDLVSWVLGAFTCGIGGLLGVLHFVPWIAAVVYPIVVGLAAKRGEWAEYPVLGQKLMREWKPLIK